MQNYFNRYQTLSSDEKTISPPLVKLMEKESDEFVQYRITKSRLDKISQDKYKSPYYGWLILMANPQYGGLEWNIIDGDLIRIPLPLNETLREYKTKLAKMISYYGE